MALVIYPTDDSDSFVTVADANDYISSLTLNSSDWSLLSDDDKERYLRIAYRDIIDHTDPATYADPLPECVGESQALMAVHDLVNNLSSGVVSAPTGPIRKNKVGSIEQEFFHTNERVGDINRVPDGAKACLSELGYDSTCIIGLTQLTLGRS